MNRVYARIAITADDWKKYNSIVEDGLFKTYNMKSKNDKFLLSECV